MPDVTIENVADIDLMAFAVWVNHNIMSIRIPQPGPNKALSGCIPEIIPLYAEIPNRMGIATELHSSMVALVANMKRDKAGLEKGDMRSEIEKTLMDANARVEILYRCIQTLAAQYEGASRLLTAAEQQIRVQSGSRNG